MSAELQFDATGVDTTNPFEPVPDGTYRTHVTASEIKDVKDGNGNKYLQLEHTVLDGPYKGRKIWDRLNIKNANKTAQDIAQRQLAQLCQATGVPRISNSSQLHHIPVMTRVTIKQDQGRDPQNVVKGYKSANAEALVNQPATVGAADAAPATPTAPAAERDDTPPWARGRRDRA